jgi:hypothetical protein
MTLCHHEIVWFFITSLVSSGNTTIGVFDARRKSILFILARRSDHSGEPP